MLTGVDWLALGWKDALRLRDRTPHQARQSVTVFLRKVAVAAMRYPQSGRIRGSGRNISGDLMLVDVKGH
jgi:hypothetical protein